MFATYLHPEIGSTSKPADQNAWHGHSYPHYQKVQQGLKKSLADYPSLPLRRVELFEYARVHTAEYLQKLQQMAAGIAIENRPRRSPECIGYEYCLPGYEFALGGMYEAIDQMARGCLERAYCMSLGGHHAHADWGHGYCLLNPLTDLMIESPQRLWLRLWPRD